MAPAADIDRLIEDGLNRYGSGDLDGALLIWEKALAIDPENPQANSYVDYVRMNYEVLQTDSGLGVSSEPFGIEEDPEYIIEITQGHELLEGEAAPPLYMDPLDQGWFIEEEQTHEVLAARTRSRNLPPESRTISADLPPVRDSMQVVEMEADEPPELEFAPLVPASGGEVSFDSATREYGSDEHRKPTSEFVDEASSFTAEATPLGFGNLETEIKKRDLGFVQPTQGSAHLEVRLRTPSTPPQKPLGSSPSPSPSAEPIDLELGGAGNAETDLYKTSRGIAPITRSPAISATSTEDDLIKSLPSPRKVTPLRGSQPLEDRQRIATRDLPDKKRPPAGVADRAETKQGDDEDIALPSAATRELGTQPAVMNTITGAPALDDFSVSAPTKELGLRPGGRPASVYPDEDAPTRQSDARQIRDEHTTQKLKPQHMPANPTGGASDGTRTDFVLPFDPIDARTKEILEAIETTVPPNESKEDRTRRRISALIERSTAWSGQGELDKAVAAVDLALSEDPNSALAQKLIHRNRDAIMNTFQAFLGDLERQPQLARPLHELASAPISPRAAFLLSRIDGMLTIDEILDVSGMPRLEAYRHLCQLFLRGILR
ncbi:MAG: hypothetical protein ABI591_01760 [Kofleriaceae bacterium]